MTVESIRNVLGWCTIINSGILLLWFLVFILAHDLIYRFHGKMFKLSEERFDAFHYGGMGLLKICIFLFNLVPYLAFRIAG